jgi:hypothetical protein
MPDKIIFAEKINDSVQIGDELWYSDISSITPTAPVSLGTIINKGDKWVKIDPAPGTIGQVYPDLITNGNFAPNWDANMVTNGDFTTDASGWGGNIGGGTEITHNSSGGWMDFGDPLGTPTPVTIYHKLNQYIYGVTVGEVYRISFEISNYQGGTLYGKLIDDVGNWISIHSNVTVDDDGVYEFVAEMPSLQNPLSSQWYDRFFLESDGNFIGSVDNISVEKLLLPTGWTGTNTTSVTISNAVIQIPSSGAHSYITQPISYVPGETYTVTFDAEGSTTNNIRVQDNNSDLGGLKATDTDTPLTTSWQEYTFNWEANNNSNNIIISRQYAAQVDWEFRIDNVVLKQTSFDLDSALGGANPEDLFFMFRKPVTQNNSGLKGYYAEVKLTNSSTSKQELFSVGSEVTISSK